MIPKEYSEYSKKFIVPRAILGSAIQFFSLVESVLNETIKYGNKNWYFGNSITDRQFDRKTRWSDFNLIRPILFNYYHGLELLMKGLLLTVGEKVESDHKLNKLFSEINSSPDIPDDIKVTLAKHIENKDLIEPIKTFINKNSISIFQLYEYLRYPINKHLSKFTDYDLLEYRGEEILFYLKEVAKDSYFLRIRSVEFFKSKAKKRR